MWRFLILVLVFVVSGCSGALPEATATSTAVPPAPTAASTAAPAPTETPVVEVTEEPAGSSVTAGSADADVTFVRAVQQGDTWTFRVTIAHPDTGWENYADGWDVVLPDGTILKPDADTPFTRLLLHPHVDEQPFTRSQSGLAIPEDVSTVTVRAHDLVDGFGGQEVVVDLSVAEGEKFAVER